MNYYDLVEYLDQLTPDQLEMEVMVHVSALGVLCPLVEDTPCCLSEGGKTLVYDHPYLVI